jgi:hypothetical protein
MDKKTLWPSLAAWTLLGSLITVHLFLISNTFFVDALGNFRVAAGGYGDIPLHLTQVSKFAFNNLGNLGDPIFFGAKLQYPFVLNFISGMLLKISQNWELAVLLPTMVLAAANIILLTLVYKKFLKNTLLAALAVIIFFLGSGWGAYPLVAKSLQFHQETGAFFQSLIDKDISAINKSDAAQDEQNIDFGAPLSMSFLHQRTFFLGLFGFLCLLLLIFKIRAKPSWRWSAVAGLIFGLMPLWHSHSFIAAFIMIAVFLLAAIKNKEQRFIRHLSLISAIGLIFALPQIFFLISSKELLRAGSGFIKFRLGWMVEAGIGSVQFGQSAKTVWSLRYLEFLWINFGLLLPSFLIASVALFSKKIRQILAGPTYFYYLAFVALGLSYFIVNQIIKFQPWDFDNNKILAYWQLFAVPAAIYFIVKIFAGKKAWGFVLLGVFTLMTISSGVFDIIPRIFKNRAQMPIIFDVSAQKTAQFIRQNIKENELILTGSSFLNPAASLAGRSVLVGYPGWLWTRGINYQEREANLKSFYQNPDRDGELLKDYPIKYILFDDAVRYDFNAEKSKFDQIFNKVFESGDYVLYKI